MKTRLVVMMSVLWAFVFAGDPADISGISTWPAKELEYLRKKQESSVGMAYMLVGPETQAATEKFLPLVKKKDHVAIANDVLAFYSTPDATTSMSGLALAFLVEYGYVKPGKQNMPKNMPLKKKSDSAGLVAAVTATVDALAPKNRSAACEFLLQVSSEGLTSMHLEAGQGGRNMIMLPLVLIAKTAEFLNDTDPFVRGMAEWAIAICVNNDNDGSGRKNPNPPNKWSKYYGRGNSWPGPNPPDWYEKWAAIPAFEHAKLDYVRQAVTLGMHRRAQDLATLAEDVQRRAEARAEWSIIKGGDAAAIKAAVAAARTKLAVVKSAGSLDAARKAWIDWRPSIRNVVLQGPDLDFSKMVAIKRFSAGKHLQPDIHGSHHPDGGDIVMLEGFDPGDKEKSLLNGKLGPGYAQELDLWFDATRIVFSWSQAKRRGLQKIFEMDLNGGAPKQLHKGPGTEVDPCYLPDGSVVCGSTLGGVGIQCASNLGGVGKDMQGGHTNIYRIMDDGSITRLTYCKDDDAYPKLLDDGRIIWMRWDYQERGVNEIFSLWSIRPDGTSSDGFFKVHVKRGRTIQALRDARPIHGTDKLVAAGGSHYTWNEGAVVVCDPSMGINNQDAMWNVTPNATPVIFGWGGLAPVPEGGVPYIGGYYCKPFALSEKTFLVSATYDQPASNAFAGYYIDVWGNKELIHRDKIHETVCLRPVRPRKKPQMLPDTTDPKKDYATVYVDDVYTDMAGIERGTIRHIRVMQMLHWLRLPTGQAIQWHPVQNPSERFGYGTGAPVRVIGTVPVHEDGSAHFKVPHDADIYFQAVDENYMVIRAMRTHVEFKPGEVRGCIGCHETKSNVIAPIRTDSLALKKPAATPVPPPWGTQKVISYEREIQPIFERKCIKCHGADSPKAGLNLTATKDKYGFMQGYRSFYGLKPGDPTPNVDWAADGPIKRERVKKPKHPWWDITWEKVLVRNSRGREGLVTQPREYFSHQHPFTQKFIKDAKHRKLLTDEEMFTIATWVDVQIPYFDTYMTREKRKYKRVVLVPYDPFCTDRSYKLEDPK